MTNKFLESSRIVLFIDHRECRICQRIGGLDYHAGNFFIIVFRGGGGVNQSSGVFLCGIIPTLIFSPLAGSLCDRFDRKKLMILSQIASGLIISGLIFTDNLVLIYLLLALQAISMSIMTPARQSSVPALVKPEELTVANAFLQQLSSLVKIYSPMLAGLILTLVSPHRPILDVLSFAISHSCHSWQPSPHRCVKTSGAKSM